MNISESLLTGKGITLSEALSFGGRTTVLGLSIVFSVLVILMLILMLFKVIFYRKNEKKKPIAVQSEQPAQTAANDEELIAVLTAAIAASMNTSTYNLKIKSYKRINDDRPVWNKAGIQDTISGRF